MLKITELNNAFEKKSFFVSAGAYNDLLGYSRGLANTLDTKISFLHNLENVEAALQKDIRALKHKIEEIKDKHHTLRNPKTGRYVKKKK